jgi:CBS domain-containing protein
MEQTLLTDQDNAIVFAEEGSARADWFQRLAERVHEDLLAAGFPSCPGGFMARNWRGPVSEWRERFQGWIETPKAGSLLQAAIFFDFRRVYGELDLAPLEEVVQRAGRTRVFLACLAKSALGFSPPASLVLRLKGGSSEVDLKKNGIWPIVYLARCYGLEVGSAARNTLERLEDAVRGGLMSDDVRTLVAGAYRFLLGLRLRLQLHLVAEGKPPSNLVQLSELSAIERSRLKDSFRAIANWQESAAYHYRTDLF